MGSVLAALSSSVSQRGWVLSMALTTVIVGEM